MVIQTEPIVWPGWPYLLAATWDGEGVNFVLFSEHATAVDLCLFDQAGRRELHTNRWKKQIRHIRIRGYARGFGLSAMLTKSARDAASIFGIRRLR